MKNRLQGLILGGLIGALLASGAAFSKQSSETAELFYNNIKITMNGQEVQPKDANGSNVEPFAINGTTYLPVRAIAEALGLNVDWNGATNTVELSNAQPNTQATGSVLYNKGGIKITYTGIQYDDYDVNIKFLIENNSSEGITVQARDESVNGFMLSGIMSDDVQPGKKANAELSFYKSALEENGITVINDLEMSFHIFNEETWDTIDDSNPIKITF